MRPNPTFAILAVIAILPLAVQPMPGASNYYEEHFTDGTTDLTWESPFEDSLGNPLTPMQVDFVAGNPEGDGWVGVIEADTASLGGIGLSVAGDSLLSDYIMEADVWVDVTDGSFYEGIIMRTRQDPLSGVVRGYQLVANFYPSFFLSRIKFRYYSTIPDSIRDIRIYDGADIPGGEPTQSGWHRFKIKAKGEQFWLYWDDQEFPDNPQTDAAISSGLFGAYIFNLGYGEVLSDDIEIHPSALFLFDPDPGEAGQNNTLNVNGATPGGRVYFVVGVRPGSVPVPAGCTGETVDIANPILIGFDDADELGNASLTVFVPPGASGRTIYMQVVEIENCKTSNRVDYTFP
jgi:hypothetical protein